MNGIGKAVLVMSAAQDKTIQNLLAKLLTIYLQNDAKAETAPVGRTDQSSVFSTKEA